MMRGASLDVVRRFTKESETHCGSPRRFALPASHGAPVWSEGGRANRLGEPQRVERSAQVGGRSLRLLPECRSRVGDPCPAFFEKCYMCDNLGKL